MPSIKDVAKLAGVGVGTVSRVINNIDVRPENREKVLAAIKELNYIPNEVARNFKMQKSKMVALLLPSIYNPFFSELAYYIEDELDNNGYKLLLCNSGGKPEKEIYYFDMLRQNKVAGIIGITYNDVEDNITTDIPLISIDRQFQEGTVCVTSDNFNGGRVALRELVKAGVKKPAYIGSVTSIEVDTMQRKEGFIHEAKALNVPYVIYEQPDPIEDEHSFLKSFIEQHRDIDGVFTITDMLAAKYIWEVKKLGIRVPEDVKVIGYDGIQDHRYFHPILSTIRQPVEDMARTAVKLLLQKIEGQAIDQQYYRIPIAYRKGETT